MNDQTGIASELNDAVDELHDSLSRATDAAARIKALLPRVNRIGAVFAELESIIESGRESVAAGPALAPARPARSRPTLTVPGAAPKRAREAPARAHAPQPTPKQQAPVAEAAPVPEALAATPPDSSEQWHVDIPAVPVSSEELTSFRLEVESHAGPLDLRAVDDAVSEHPAVRDVALLDYDGRRATLKVWIAATASVAEVQQTLTDRAQQVIGNGGDVSIIALEDVA